MPLTQIELEVLKGYLLTNRLLGSFLLLGDLVSVQGFLSQIPTEGKIDTLLIILTPLDRHKLFANDDFKTFYSDFSLMIAEDTTIKVKRFIDDIPFTNQQLDILCLELLNGIVSNGQTDLTIQDILIQLITSDKPTLKLLIQSFGATGIFEETTLDILKIELNLNNPRWQSLGLSSAPTEAEVQNALSLP